jgi:hypothetical protein
MINERIKMKADVVFVHGRDPRHVLKVNGGDYFVVRSTHQTDMSAADQITGDLTMRGVKWLLNVTRGTLVDVEIIGRHGSMQDAIMAATQAKLNTQI